MRLLAPGAKITYLRHWLGVKRGKLENNILQPLGSERDKGGGETPVNAELEQNSDPEEHE